MVGDEFAAMHDILMKKGAASRWSTSPASYWQRYGISALVNFQFHMAACVYNSTQVVIEHIRVHNNFLHACLSQDKAKLVKECTRQMPLLLLHWHATCSMIYMPNYEQGGKEASWNSFQIQHNKHLLMESLLIEIMFRVMRKEHRFSPEMVGWPQLFCAKQEMVHYNPLMECSTPAVKQNIVQNDRISTQELAPLVQL